MILKNSVYPFNYKKDKALLLKSLIFPVGFVVLLWLIKVIESFFNLDFATLGIFPLKWTGLTGIISAPLIHSDLEHLLSNTFATFFLSWAIVYFYREISGWVIAMIYILSGFWVWFFAREAYHIGASGLIYGMASFLFFSGVFRRHVPLAALSLVIVFLYGGIIWGVFPTYEHISWETHLTGLVAGIIAAIYYRREGPQRPEPFASEVSEEDEEDEATEVPEENSEGNTQESDKNIFSPSGNESITWHYIEKQKKNPD